MKPKKLLLPLAVIAMSCIFTFSACGAPDDSGGMLPPTGTTPPDTGTTPPDTGTTPPDGGFTNPGDSLGGGGTGEVAGEKDTTGSESAKKDVEDQSDLGELSQNTSKDGAIECAPSASPVEIKESGTYLFQGDYGGIVIAKSSLKLHFIFDGAHFEREGVAIDGSDSKKTELVITLCEGSENTVKNSGNDVNAVHIKGSLGINGTGVLNVVSESKSALKASKDIKIVDATLNLAAANHGITGASVTAANCKISVSSAGKDGINAECDDAQEFTTEDGFVSLKNVEYTCSVSGDGIQADTVVYIDGGSYDITTNGVFVVKNAENMQKYGMAADDFRYTKVGDSYQKLASDELRGTLYGLTQSCKGIKAGEISYEDDDGNEVTVTEGDYLIAISSGTFVINSTDDAIHTNSGDVLIEGGTFTISTLDDGITCDVLTKITGGDITITTCYEGIEGAYVEISGGTIVLTSTDDGINAASDDKNITEHIIISGGDITVDASGDGLDSNGSILISGGTVVVYGPTSGMDAGLDADRGIVITGGYVFATSTLGMVETPSSNSTQYVVSYAHQSTITAGSVVSLADSDGNTLFSIEILKNCQSVIFSTPDLEKGATYTLYGGDTQLTSFTVSSILTTIGSAGSSFPGGGGMGGNTPPGGFGGFGGPRR